MKPLLCLLMAELLLLQFLSVGGSPGVIYAAAPAERGAFHVGGKGVYNYGYNTGDGIAKVEVRNADGSVTGSYRYFDPLGRQIVRSYIADKRGFRVLGNELPVAPGTPAIGIVNAQTLTGPVEGTQEFSSPNIVTPDEANLIYQSGNAVGHVTLVKKDSGNTGQEAKLARLKAEYENLVREQKRKIEELENFQRQEQKSYQTVQQPSTSYWFKKAFDFDSPYFYSPDRIDYDFPAGFAYNAAPVRYTYNVRTVPKVRRRPYIIGHAR